MPHRKNVACRATRSPGRHDNTTVEPSNRYEPLFAIIKTIVLPRRMTSGEDFGGIGEIKPSLLQRSVALDGVECDVHDIYVTTYFNVTQRKSVRVIGLT